MEQGPLQAQSLLCHLAACAVAGPHSMPNYERSRGVLALERLLGITAILSEHRISL